MTKAEAIFFLESYDSGVPGERVISHPCLEEAQAEQSRMSVKARDKRLTVQGEGGKAARRDPSPRKGRGLSGFWPGLSSGSHDWFPPVLEQGALSPL